MQSGAVPPPRGQPAAPTVNGADLVQGASKVKAAVQAAQAEYAKQAEIERQMASISVVQTAASSGGGSVVQADTQASSANMES